MSRDTYSVCLSFTLEKYAPGILEYMWSIVQLLKSSFVHLTLHDRTTLRPALALRPRGTKMSVTDRKYNQSLL